MNPMRRSGASFVLSLGLALLGCATSAGASDPPEVLADAAPTGLSEDARAVEAAAPTPDASTPDRENGSLDRPDSATMLAEARIGLDAGPDRLAGPDDRPDTPAVPLDGPAAARGTPGCGQPATGTSSYQRRTIVVRGVERESFLWVPRTYDAQRPYPIVFRWHGSGGNGTSGGLEIEATSREDAIIASPSGLGGLWTLTAAGPDVELFDTLLRQLGAELCLDTGRVFSYGFSMGGMMSNLLACVRGNVVRGVAPVAGSSYGDSCVGKVAAFIVHGANDLAVPVAMGAAARDRYRTLNGCGATAQPEPPAPCVRYEGCPAQFPVVWCQTAIGHNPQGAFSGPGAWNFFKSLP